MAGGWRGEQRHACAALRALPVLIYWNSRTARSAERNIRSRPAARPWKKKKSWRYFFIRRSTKVVQNSLRPRARAARRSERRRSSARAEAGHTDSVQRLTSRHLPNADGGEMMTSSRSSRPAIGLAPLRSTGSSSRSARTPGGVRRADAAKLKSQRTEACAFDAPEDDGDQGIEATVAPRATEGRERP